MGLWGHRKCWSSGCDIVMMDLGCPLPSVPCYWLVSLLRCYPNAPNGSIALPGPVSSDLLLILVPIGTRGSEPIPSCYDSAWPADVIAIPFKPHTGGSQFAQWWLYLCPSILYHAFLSSPR